MNFAIVVVGDDVVERTREVIDASEADWVVFVDGAVPDAALVNALVDGCEADVAYGDARTANGSVVRRPDPSPERLRNQYYLGMPLAVRKAALGELGGIDASLPGAEVYDLTLRAMRAGRAFEHRPVVFDSTDASSRTGAAVSIRLALERHLAATGGGTVVATGRQPEDAHDTRREVVGRPLVSIVIPSRARWSTDGHGARHSYLLDAVASIASVTEYDAYEVVIVVDDGFDADLVEEVGRRLGDRLRIVIWTKPFNFSDKVNLGVVHSHGEFVLLLNDDVRVLSRGWIDALLALAQLPNAGMVGAKLYFEDGTIQHAGHAYWQGDASHIGLDEPGDARGPLDGYLVEREVAGVTAACALMPRAVYDEVGGLTGLLPGAFNDVDLCMKTTWRGYDIYWTPHAELVHYESKSRDASVRGYEVAVAWGRWGFRMHQPGYWPYPLTRAPHPR